MGLDADSIMDYNDTMRTPCAKSDELWLVLAFFFKDDNRALSAMLGLSTN